MSCKPQALARETPHRCGPVIIPPTRHNRITATVRPVSADDYSPNCTSWCSRHGLRTPTPPRSASGNYRRSAPSTIAQMNAWSIVPAHAHDRLVIANGEPRIAPTVTRNPVPTTPQFLGKTTCVAVRIPLRIRAVPRSLPQNAGTDPLSPRTCPD